MPNETRDSGRFSLKQKKFYDGSAVVVHTANLSVLFGTIVKHKKSRFRSSGEGMCWKLVIEIPIHDNEQNGDANNGEKEDQLLLGSGG